MPIKEVYFSTSSKSRLATAKQLFWKNGIIVKPLPKSYAEVQSKTGKEIALATARQASKEYRMPVLREYKSLFINSLGGFPGPYLHHFHHEIPADKLLEILKNHSDRSGKFIIDSILALPDNQVFEASTNIQIKLSKKISGSKGNWEKIIMRESSSNTFSEEIEKKNPDFLSIWHQNLTKLSEQLTKG